MNLHPVVTPHPSPEPFLPVTGIDVKELLAILRRRRWVIATTVVVMSTFAVLTGLQITPRYTARALIMIDPRQSRVVQAEAVVQDLGTDAATVETQIQVITSRALAEKVVDELQLTEDPEFNTTLRRGTGEVAAAVGDLLRLVTTWLPDSWPISAGLARELISPGLSPEAKAGLGRQAAISAFGTGLVAEQEGRAYVIGINFTSKDPEKAARIVNTLAKLYVRDQIDTKLAATAKATDFLGKRLAMLRDEVQMAEAAVESFREQHELISADGSPLREQELSDLSRKLISARTDLAAKEAKLKLVRDLRARSGRDLDTVGDVLGSPVIIKLREQETLLNKDESELRTLFGEKHPRMQALLTEKRNLQAKVQLEVDRIIRSLENEVEVITTSVLTIEQEMEQLKRRTEADNEVAVKLRELEREAQASRRLYESFLDRFKDTREQQNIIEADAKIISAAIPPDAPSSPGPKIFGAAGFTASLLLGTLLALLRERLDGRINSAKQIEQVLGMPALGAVPRLKRLRRHQKPHQCIITKPFSTYAESIRAIHTSLRMADRRVATEVVLVTSSLPAEGKTTLALSLATFAATSARVLLMDVDLRHPSVHRDLGVKPGHGLVEYMDGEAKLDEVLTFNEEAGFWYLPIKRQTANPSVLLDTQRMRQLMVELRGMFDLIILDSAPVLGIAESRVVARYADRILFAMQCGKTDKDAALQALKQLGGATTSIAGIVLTQVDVTRNMRAGYIDFCHQYGSYKKYYNDIL